MIYELLVACFYYAFIAASIAEVRISTLFSLTTNLLPTFQVAHVFHPLRRRRIPLGLCNAWSPIWPHARLLHRLSQFLRMDIRSRLSRLHSIQRGSADVRRFPSRSGHPAMARLCCFRAHHLVLLRACHFRQPSTPIPESGWIVPDYRGWNRDHHRRRSDAQGACF